MTIDLKPALSEEQLDAMSFDGVEQQLTMVPVYHMKHYPTVMRKNISAKGRFMGVSDVQAVLPLQEAMKKLDTKILEKLLKGGSYVTLPDGVKVDTTDAELKILRLKTAGGSVYLRKSAVEDAGDSWARVKRRIEHLAREKDIHYQDSTEQ